MSWEKQQLFKQAILIFLYLIVLERKPDCNKEDESDCCIYHMGKEDQVKTMK